MKLIVRIKHCMLAALLVGFVGTAPAQEPPPPTAEEIAAQAADAQFLADLAAIANDRYGTIAGIAATWDSQVLESAAELEEFLSTAADEQLLNIQNATS